MIHEYLHTSGSVRVRTSDVWCVPRIFTAVKGWRDFCLQRKQSPLQKGHRHPSCRLRGGGRFECVTAAVTRAGQRAWEEALWPVGIGDIGRRGGEARSHVLS